MDDGDDDLYAREPDPGDVVRICRALNEASLKQQTPRPQDALDCAFLEGVLRARDQRR